MRRRHTLMMRSRIAMATAFVLLTAPILRTAETTCASTVLLVISRISPISLGRLAAGHPLQHLDLAQREEIGPLPALREPERLIKRMPGDVLMRVLSIRRSDSGVPEWTYDIEAGRDIVIFDRGSCVCLRREAAVGVLRMKEAQSAGRVATTGEVNSGVVYTQDNLERANRLSCCCIAAIATSRKFKFCDPRLKSIRH